MKCDRWFFAANRHKGRNHESHRKSCKMAKLNGDQDVAIRWCSASFNIDVGRSVAAD